jgi:hypothetical protein
MEAKAMRLEYQMRHQTPQYNDSRESVRVMEVAEVAQSEQARRDAMVFGARKSLPSEIHTVKFTVKEKEVDTMLIDAINAKLAILGEIYN